jgi:hypothetical protein
VGFGLSIVLYCAASWPCCSTRVAGAFSFRESGFRVTDGLALYNAEGANMFGGCLPLLLQMPLLFAYMSVLRNAAELHQAN